MFRRILITAAFIVLTAASWSVGQTIKEANGIKVACVNISKCMQADPYFAEQQKVMQAIAIEKEKAFKDKTKKMNDNDKLREYQKIRAELDAERLRITRDVSDHIKKKISTIASDAGYSIVLDSQVVLYGGTDITDKVIAVLK
ncbi:MAG: OmpH family outer membrane protein [bacterium]|jgi:outer membrane protein|nr:OmpH family outer membrane protein [bacterium]MDD4152360.1 OmpH family outer membrane protein [bacterium]MDD4557971.1 OmpH family outer membrane protein [bacterium]